MRFPKPTKNSLVSSFLLQTIHYYINFDINNNNRKLIAPMSVESMIYLHLTFKEFISNEHLLRFVGKIPIKAIKVFQNTMLICACDWL